MIPAGTRPPLPWQRRVLADLRVPTRMLIVVLVPLLAAMGFAGLRIKDALDVADTYAGTEQIAKTSRTGTKLIAALARERDLAVDPQASTREGGKKAGDEKGRAETDAQAHRFLQEIGRLPGHTGMERQRKVTTAGVDSLVDLRKLSDSGSADPAQVEHGYGGVIVSIASLYNQVGGIGEQARGAGWTLYTIALNKAMVTSQRSVLSSATTTGVLTTGQLGNIVSAQLVRDITAMEFGLYAQPAEAAEFQRILGSDRALALSASLQKLSVSAATGQLTVAKVGLPKTWYEDLTRADGELTQLQEKVEQRVLAEAAAQKETAHDQVVTDLVIAVVVLLLATLLVLATSRHLVRGLGWLRRSAVSVADEHLPEVTRHLNAGSPLPAALEGKVLAPRTRDEIGDVGRAFDRVYLEAVGLARQQAAMREEVNQLFQNLSRRNQGLVQRQLAVITELEGAEHSPDGLARLFHLDHLATQIRRNSENLLVLAGAEITAERRETTELLAVVRTAASEIEEYQRVTYRAVPPLGVVGYAADDLVHLVAELLDNAASFSSPDTWVVVSGQRMPDGRLLLEIRDQGIGMSAEQLATADDVLRQQAGRRNNLSESMGLYVVGALARKHAVDVRLYANTPAGLVAALVLPESLLVRQDQPGAEQPSPGQLPTGPLPTGQLPTGQLPTTPSSPGQLSTGAISGGRSHAGQSPAGQRPAQASPTAQAPAARPVIRGRAVPATSPTPTGPAPAPAPNRPAGARAAKAADVRRPGSDHPTLTFRALGGPGVGGPGVGGPGVGGPLPTAAYPAQDQAQNQAQGQNQAQAQAPSPAQYLERGAQGGPAHESTSAGLPVRRRRPRAGSITAPGNPVPAATPAPAVRPGTTGGGAGTGPLPDPEEIRRRMSGLYEGIAHAGPAGTERSADAGPQQQEENR
ncbi:nitrate- and nitrite sensing domain-containing protein [Streptomyces sp. NPDC059917]|uniref:sensor histidine kinase n=1 Tax=Streptomyces sp. NPDC059917 TaxID=3347002 RepID=UPI003661A9B0